VQISLPLGDDVWGDIHTMQELDAALRRHEGDDRVEVVVPRLDANPLTLRSRGRKVEWSALLGAELEEIVGPGRVTVDDQPPLVMPSRFASKPAAKSIA
jgi:hypothetical protein